jgi:FkbM family methyltransferase
MFYKLPIYKKFLRNICWKVFNYLENNNNANIEKNGELTFIKNFLKIKSNKDHKELFIFDIGANIGGYTDIIIKESNKSGLNVFAHLFEPQKNLYIILQEKYKNLNNIQVNNFALSDENTTTHIYYNKEGSGLASLYKRKLKHYKINFDKSEKILLKRADSYIQENELTHIDLIKIDVEGHELNVFFGFGEYLNGDFIDFIQFEYGGTNLDSKTSLLDIYSYLEEGGFIIAKIYPQGLEIRDYKPFMENYCYSNYVAISKKILEDIER